MFVELGEKRFVTVGDEEKLCARKKSSLWREKSFGNFFFSA